MEKGDRVRVISLHKEGRIESVDTNAGMAIVGIPYQTRKGNTGYTFERHTLSNLMVLQEEKENV